MRGMKVLDRGQLLIGQIKPKWRSSLAKFTIEIRKEELKTLDALIEAVRAKEDPRSVEDSLELDIMLQILKQKDKSLYRRVRRKL